MATIDSRKLLPSSNKSNAIEKPKFLVPIKNISTKKISGSDLKPLDKKAETSGSLVVIKNKIIKLDNLIQNNLLIDQKERSRKKKEEERTKVEKRESDIEKKVKKNDVKSDLIPSLPGQSIFDKINRFIGFTLLGYLFNKYGELLPKLMEFGKVLKPVGEFFEGFAKNLLKGVVDFIEFGYKAYDQSRDFVKQIGGEGAQKTFDEFSKQLNLLLNGAIATSMLIISSSPKKSGVPDKRKMPGAKPSSKVTFGHDTPRPKVNAKSFASGAAGLGIGVLGDIAIQKLGESINQSIISNKINEAKKLSPENRKKYIEKLNNQLKREKDYQASLLFSLDKIKELGGETQSEKLTTTLLAILTGLGEKPKYAEGGQVSRGGQSTVAPSRKLKTKTRKAPPRIQPQKTQPGKDVGGKLKIEELYGKDEPGKRSALRALRKSSEDVKRMKSINGLAGSMFGAGIDMALGQRPDKNLSRNLGNIFGSVIASAVDMELNNSFGDISRTIAMANGGIVPSREIGRSLSIGERIGSFISRALAVSIESSASKILQNLRNEMNLEGGAPGGGDGMPPGEVPAADISEDQRKASNDLIKYFEKLYGKNAAIGIVANLLRESGLRTTTPDNASYEGMAQWDRAHRWPAFVKWAQSKGKDPYSRSAQAEWIAIELKQLGTDARLKNAKTPEEAASLFYNEFERAAYSKPILGDKYTPDNPHERKNRSFIQSLTGGSIEYIPPDKNISLEVTSRRGMRDGKMHEGSDIATKEGTPLRVVSDGQIVDSGVDPGGWGNFVVYKDDKGIYHLYGHVQNGYKRSGSVKKGDIIAKVGMTGRTSGPHLHWEAGSGWNKYQITGRFDPLDRYSQNAPFSTPRQTAKPPSKSNKPSDIFKWNQSSVAPSQTSTVASLNRTGALKEHTSGAVALIQKDIYLATQIVETA